MSDLYALVCTLWSLHRTPCKVRTHCDEHWM